MVSKFNFLCSCQQWNTSNAAEIKADGISCQTTTLTLMIVVLRTVGSSDSTFQPNRKIPEDPHHPGLLKLICAELSTLNADQLI